MKSEPISIRVDDTLVSTLKGEARRLAVEYNRDVLYTDLIRGAVQEFASKIEKDAMMSDSDCDVVLDHNAPLSSRNTVLSSLSSILSTEMSEDEWLSMFGFIRNSLSTALQNQAKPIVESLSLPRAVLEIESYKPGNSYDRDVAGIIYVISRRGAVPDMIQEGETYLIPTFQIACNPAVTIDKILDKNVKHLANLALKSATNMAKEETSNFCALLEAAGMNREPIRVESITLDTLSQGYDLLVKNGQSPWHLIMSPVTFTKLSREAATKRGNWEFKALTIDNQPVGHYQGAVIRVTDRIYPYDCETAYFVTANAGYLIEKQPLTALMYPNPPKLRGSIVMWSEIGMSISADYMLSCMTTKVKE